MCPRIGPVHSGVHPELGCSIVLCGGSESLSKADSEFDWFGLC